MPDYIVTVISVIAILSTLRPRPKSFALHHRAEANVSTDLRAEPHLAVADDAREGELAAVGGHVLLQPTPGAGDHIEDLAAVPQTPERSFQLGLPDLGPALVQLTDDVHSLVEKRKRN